MARRIYHYYNGVDPVQDKVLCGSTIVFRAFRTADPQQVTCQKCRAGLMKRGLLPRPVVGAAPIQGGARPTPPRPTPRPVQQSRPDPDNVDDYNNNLLRLGIL